MLRIDVLLVQFSGPGSVSKLKMTLTSYYKPRKQESIFSTEYVPDFLLCAKLKFKSNLIQQFREK